MTRFVLSNFIFLGLWFYLVSIVHLSVFSVIRA